LLAFSKLAQSSGILLLEKKLKRELRGQEDRAEVQAETGKEIAPRKSPGGGKEARVKCEDRKQEIREGSRRANSRGEEGGPLGPSTTLIVEEGARTHSKR